MPKVNKHKLLYELEPEEQDALEKWLDDGVVTPEFQSAVAKANAQIPPDQPKGASQFGYFQGELQVSTHQSRIFEPLEHREGVGWLRIGNPQVQLWEQISQVFKPGSIKPLKLRPGG